MIICKVVKFIIGNVCVMCLGDVESVHYLFIHSLFAMTPFFQLSGLSLAIPRIDQEVLILAALGSHYVDMVFFGEFHLLLSFFLIGDKAL